MQKLFHNFQLCKTGRLIFQNVCYVSKELTLILDRNELKFTYRSLYYIYNLVFAFGFLEFRTIGVIKVENEILQYCQFGDPLKVLKLYKSEVTPLKDTEVLVKMISSPINPSDLIPIKGSYAHRTQLPCIAGYEGVGIVVAVGSRVTSSLIGVRVLPLRGEGTWQQFVKCPIEYLIRVPSTINDDIACQLYINPLTAWVICTEYLNLQKGNTILMNAGGSVIARIFSQLSNIVGFKLILVIRNDQYVGELLDLGAWKIINSSLSNVHEVVMDITLNKGVNVSIDSVGGESGELLGKCTKKGGQYLSLGLLSGKQVNWKKISNEYKLNTQLFSLRIWNQKSSIEGWQYKFEELINLILNKKLKLMDINNKYDFKDYESALNGVLCSERKGKITLAHNPMM